MKPSPRPPRAILFDKDGTLVDAFEGWVGLIRDLHEDLVAWYGTAPLDAAGERALGITGRTVVAGGTVASGTEDELFAVLHRLAGPRAPDWSEFRRKIGERARARFEVEPPRVHPLGQIKTTLAWLKNRGIVLGIATSDTYANAFRDLGPHGAEFFDFWSTADRVDRPKPHPESVFRFCGTVDIPPAEVVFVGDSRVDLEAARAAGVGLFVAVRSATCPADVLAEADLVVNTIEELIPALFES